MSLKNSPDFNRPVTLSRAQRDFFWAGRILEALRPLDARTLKPKIPRPNPRPDSRRGSPGSDPLTPQRESQAGGDRSPGAKPSQIRGPAGLGFTEWFLRLRVWGLGV